MLGPRISLQSRIFALTCCFAMSVAACGEAKKDNPKQAPSKATVDDCKSQLKVYEDCHAEELTKGSEAAKASKLDSAAVASKIAAVTDVASCTALLSELQKDGVSTCWPS